VLDEIVQLLTEPKYQGKMVVILAGYEAQVSGLCVLLCVLLCALLSHPALMGSCVPLSPRAEQLLRSVPPTVALLHSPRPAPQVEALMAVNPGLKSRFSEKLHFRDFTALEACQLLRAQLRKDSLQLAAGAEEQLPDLMQQVGWAGGAGKSDLAGCRWRAD
jgi:hypothetical protein